MTDIVYNKNGIAFDIDAIATDLNGKADKDLSNISASQTAKNTIIGWGMPDYENGINITALPYTAPSDGYVDVAINACGNTVGLFDNGVKIGHAYASNASFYAMISGQYRVKQGDVISTTDNSYLQWATFFPMKGIN